MPSYPLPWWGQLSRLLRKAGELACTSRLSFFLAEDLIHVHGKSPSLVWPPAPPPTLPLCRWSELGQFLGEVPFCLTIQ